MINVKRIKIVISLVLSLVITFFIVRSEPAPQPLNFTQVRSTVFSTINNLPKILTSLTKINLIPQNKKIEEKIPPKNQSNFFSNSTQSPSAFPSASPPPKSSYKPPTIKPTIKKLPTPTAKPKPTAKPPATPTLEISSGPRRSGNTPDEVLAIASRELCVPEPLLKATARVESGKFFWVVSPKSFLFYNQYNWWNHPNVTKEKICGGYGFNVNTGIIPQDSKFAGERCGQVKGDDIQAMGPFMTTYYGYTKMKEAVKKILKTEVDKRVMLDSAMMGAWELKEGGKNPSGCTNWDFKYMLRASCRYYGTCGFNNGVYYCNTICRFMNEFGGNFDCNKVQSIIKDDCTFK